MGTVTLDGEPEEYEVYGTPAAALKHIRGLVGAGPRAFMLLDPNEQNRLHVAATVWIDTHDWQGKPTTPAVDGTTLAWPRTNVTILVDGEATAVDDQTVPADLIKACYEMMAVLAADESQAAKKDQASNFQSLTAGPVSATYFAPTSVGEGTATIMPPTVERYAGKYLNSSVSAPRGGAWYGASCEGDSHFDDDSSYARKDVF